MSFIRDILYAQGELRIARGKFSQLKEQAKENKVIAASKMNDTFFQNSEKTLIPVNTTQTLAAELKTSTDTASRIIQIQAKADEPTKKKFLGNRVSVKIGGNARKQKPAFLWRVRVVFLATVRRLRQVL
jgi:hypothetical protein